MNDKLKANEAQLIDRIREAYAPRPLSDTERESLLNAVNARVDPGPKWRRLAAVCASVCAVGLGLWLALPNHIDGTQAKTQTAKRTETSREQPGSVNAGAIVTALLAAELEALELEESDDDIGSAEEFGEYAILGAVVDEAIDGTS